MLGDPRRLWTHETAVAKLAADLQQHEADTASLGYPRKLMLADEDAVRAIVRPQSVIEAEERRAERDSSGTTGGAGVSPVANGLELDRPRPPAVFGDNTPPRPQDVTESDYAEDDWQSLMADTENE